MLYIAQYKMKNSDRYKFRIFLKTKLISVSIFEFYTERYIVVYTVYYIRFQCGNSIESSIEINSINPVKSG